MNTRIGLLATLVAAIIITACAAWRCWRRAGRDVDSMAGVVKPCPACAPEPHGAPECICVLFCGAMDCTGSEDKLFAAWEAQCQRSKLRRVK